MQKDPVRIFRTALAMLAAALAACSSPSVNEPAPKPYVFDADASWLKGYQMFVYGRPPLSYLQQARATAVVWSVYHGAVTAAEEQYVRDLHRHGIRVASNFSTMQGSMSVANDEKLIRETACATFDGTPTKALWIVPNSPYLPCNNNPAWLDFLQKRAYEHVDGEADSLDIDEVEGIAGHLYFAGFDEHCMAGFRKYLAARFTPTELQQKFGISDVATFNYRDYLVAAGVKAGAGASTVTSGSPVADDPNPELRRQYVRFQLVSRQQSMRSIITHTRSYAKDRYVSFTANTFFLNANKISFIPDLDYLVYENTIDFPPQGRLIGEHFLARAAAPGKPAAMFPNIIDLLFFKDGQDWGVYLHWIIEAFAAGESFLIPHNAYVFGGGELSVSGSVTLPASMLRPYADFMKAHWAAHDAEPVANVAVLFPYGVVVDQYIDKGYKTPWMISEAAHKRYNDVTHQLQEAHIPFKTLFSGDGELYPRQLRSADLKGITTLLVPTSSPLDATTQTVLDAFAASGGKVLTGENFTVEDVRAVGALPVATSAPKEIGLVYAANAERLFLHVINYDYRKKEHVFQPPAPFQVTLEDPRTFSSANAEAWLHVPGAASRKLEVTSTQGKISFTLDGVRDYALVEIR